MTFLNLQRNGINLVETSAFDDMPRLKTLELDGNKIKKIDPHWFSGSPMVEGLGLSENELSDLPEGAFQNMIGDVFKLWLMNNSISSIHPRAFQGVKSAVFLMLHNNKIAQLDDDLFANMQKIRFLTLGGNRLKCVSNKFLRNLRAGSISFYGNPLDSDCVTKLQTWASDNNVVLSQKIVMDLSAKLLIK